MTTKTGHSLIRPLVALVALAAAMAALLIAYNANSAQAAPVCSTNAAGTTTCTYGSTGAEDTFVVPDGVSSVHVEAIGAPGAVGAGGTAGRGAVVSGDLAVTPGQTLYVEVGGVPTGRIGGFNGGGSSSQGGGGGGASDVRTVSRSGDPLVSLQSRLIVAAGGGGSGLGGECSDGGAATGGSGGDAGSDGGNGGSCPNASGGIGGKEGTQSAGGAGGGAGPTSGKSGSLGQGGNAGDGSGSGGAGGGGYYGGGGGQNRQFGPVNPEGASDVTGAGGGGGGSSLVPQGGSGPTITSDSPSITISYTLPPVNQAPTVAVDKGGQCGPASDMRGTINLALSDPDTPPEEITLSATSSNRTVVPQNNLIFGGGTDDSRTLTVTAVKGSGTSTITVRASDGELQSAPLTIVVVSGTSANDALTGTDGNDMIFARKGADSLGGLGANDLLCGGNGKDVLTGGAGADHFGGGYGSADTATDFDAGDGDTRRGIENF